MIFPVMGVAIVIKIVHVEGFFKLTFIIIF